MAELHEQFLGIAGPTDVLTFPLEVDRRGRPLAGEVVVCVPEARRRSAAEGTGLRQEVLLYALHGLLHLCGFDDRTRSGFAAMHRTEDAILTTLGIGPVFSARGDSHAKRKASTANSRIRRDRATSPGASAKSKPQAKETKSGGSNSKQPRPLSSGGVRPSAGSGRGRASGRVD